MLHFFRKYQKGIFLFVTVVIICSFVFFGTYQAFAPRFSGEEKSYTAYTTLKGKKIDSRYFNQLCQFLATEGMGRDFFENNYLSDHVISREFLHTGLALDLVAQDPERYRLELDERLEKEKKYTPYVHPMAKHISARAIWELFSPDMGTGLAALQKAECGISSVEARVDLFNAQRRFPPQFLAGILRNQERDTKGITPDLKLGRNEMALFGYHSIADWFGPTFVKRVAEVVIETVEQAKKEGYRVTKEEALIEMLYKSEQTVSMLKEQMDIPSSMNGANLLQTYMRQLGYDEKTLVKVYQDLLLFKRYLYEGAESVVLDPSPFEAFYAHAGEGFTVEVVQMPKIFRFQTRESLKEFECYLAALDGRREDRKPLLLPTHMNPRDELKGDRYEVFLGCVDKGKLEARVTVKETWNWEKDHWQELRAHFAFLPAQGGDPLTILDGIEKGKRERIDAFARRQLVEAHPEWIDEAIKQVDIKYHNLFLAKRGARLSLPGLEDGEALKQVLEGKDELIGYSQDGTHYYRLVVQDRKKDQLLTFEEAKQLGVIETLSRLIDGEGRVRTVIGQIRSAMRERGLNLTDEEAIAYRFYHHLTQPEGTLEQFAPINQVVTLERGGKGFLSFETLQTQESGEGFAEDEGVYRYQVVEHTVDRTLPMDKLLKGNELLGSEVRTSMLREMIKRSHV